MRVRTLSRALLVIAICMAPTVASAQRRRGRGQTTPTAPAGGATAPAGGGDTGGGMSFGVDEANQTGTTPPAGGAATPDTGTGGAATPDTGTGGAAGAGGGLEGIGGQDVTAQRRPIRENIYAVQQIYALRNRRFELRPMAGFSLNDPFVSHTGAGLSASFWVSNVLAVGANFVWFQGLNGRSDVDYRLARSTHIVVPVNEYQLAASANFSYVPLYGKFLIFNQFIFHWDLYLTAGVGVMRTRPIAVVDPEVRSFDWNTSILFNAGVGIRVFVNRFFGIVAELQNYIYLESLEAISIAPLDIPGSRQMGSRQDPATWRGQSALTDNVMLTVGLTFFLPAVFSYRLQR